MWLSLLALQLQMALLGKLMDNNEEVVIANVPVNEMQNLRMSTLRILVTSTDNATNITCVVVSLNPFTNDESDPVLLLVQGADE